MEKQILTVAAVDPREVGAFLRSRLGLSGAAAVRRVLEGSVWIAGRRAKAPKDKLQLGERVTVYLESRPLSRPSPGQLVAGPLGSGPSVLFADERLMVVDKPAGLDSQPGRRGGPSLLTVLPAPLFLVHRLDAEASGLVVLARDPESAARLAQGFAEGQPAATALSREYLALVVGRPSGESGCIELRIGRQSRSGPMSPRYRVHPSQSTQGQSAATQYRLLTADIPGSAVGIASPSGQSLSLIWLRLETGRTHQIRLHLAALGHPIVGDRLYGGLAASRLFLHAARLRLLHPETRERLAFSSPPPAGFPAAPPPHEDESSSKSA